MRTLPNAAVKFINQVLLIMSACVAAQMHSNSTQLESGTNEIRLDETVSML
jgi:hypothetical protein